MTKQQLAERLIPYLPTGSANWVADQVVTHHIFLSIKRGRRSKLGDYRSPVANLGHRISVNAELNPWEFLVTFVHELAHLLCYEQHKNKVKPHGTEWKTMYSELLERCIHLGFFPESLHQVLTAHIHKPGASTCSDPQMHKALSAYGGNTVTTLDEIPDGGCFRLGNRKFKKGVLMRSRFKCLSLDNHRIYWVNRNAHVESQ
jgi:SprT protein